MELKMNAYIKAFLDKVCMGFEEEEIKDQNFKIYLQSFREIRAHDCDAHRNKNANKAVDKLNEIRL